MTTSDSDIVMPMQPKPTSERVVSLHREVYSDASTSDDEDNYADANCTRHSSADFESGHAWKSNSERASTSTREVSSSGVSPEDRTEDRMNHVAEKSPVNMSVRTDDSLDNHAERSTTTEKTPTAATNFFAKQHDEWDGSVRRRRRRGSNAVHVFRDQDTRKSGSHDAYKISSLRHFVQQTQEHKEVPCGTNAQRSSCERANLEQRSGEDPEIRSFLDDEFAQQDPHDTICKRIFKIVFALVLASCVAGALIVSRLSFLFYANRASSSLDGATFPLFLANMSGPATTIGVADVCSSRANLPLRYAVGCFSGRLWFALTLIGVLPAVVSAIQARISSVLTRDVVQESTWIGRPPSLTSSAIILIAFVGALIESVSAVLFLMFVVPFAPAFDVQTSILAGSIFGPLLIQFAANVVAHRLGGESAEPLYWVVLQGVGAMLSLLCTSIVAYMQHDAITRFMMAISILLYSLTWWRSGQHLFVNPLRLALKRYHYREAFYRNAMKAVFIASGCYCVAKFYYNLDSPLESFSTASPEHVVVDTVVGSGTVVLPQPTFSLAESDLWDLYPALVCVLSAFVAYRLATQLLRAALARWLAVVLIMSPVVVLAFTTVYWNSFGMFQGLFGEGGAWPVYSSANDSKDTIFLLGVFCVACAAWACSWRFWHEIHRHNSNQKDQALWTNVGFDSVLGAAAFGLNRNHFSLYDSTQTDSNWTTGHFTFIMATLYREDEEEMRGLLKSIFKLAHGLRREEQGRYRMFIAFDAAFGENVIRTPLLTYPPGLNDFAVQFLDVLCELGGQGSSNHLEFYHRTDAESVAVDFKIPTPDDGIPLLLTCVFKNPEVTKQGKRWSQLLLFSMMIEEVSNNRALLDRLDNRLFVLCLDGDTQFAKHSLDTLHDTLCNSSARVGAACGRVVPVGFNNKVSPLVFIQKFEYASGHWFVKSAEHLFGSVLCAPGCWSMLRFNALLQPAGSSEVANVGKSILERYSQEVRSAMDALMYDQGEDRMMSSLLIKEGYSLRYSANSTATSYCPTTLAELIRQRRRWIASTLANQVQLLGWWKSVVKHNPSMSSLYMVFVFCTTLSSLLGPATVALLTQGAFAYAFRWDSVFSAIISLALPLSMVVVCALYWYDLTTDSTAERSAKIAKQVSFAMALSVIYALVMCAVVVAIAVKVFADFEENGGVPHSPDTWFFLSLIILFAIAGLVHGEIKTLFAGITYFVMMPMTHMLFVIFAIANMQDLSWGTRERHSETVQEELRPLMSTGWIRWLPELFVWFRRRCCAGYDELRDAEKQSAGEISDTASSQRVEIATVDDVANKTMLANQISIRHAKLVAEAEQRQLIARSNLISTRYAFKEETLLSRDKRVEKAKVEYLRSLADHLRLLTFPVPIAPEVKQARAADMKSLAHSVSGVFLFSSLCWITLALSLGLHSQLSVLGSSVLGLMFLLVFGALLVTEFFALLAHRWDTLLHVIASTPMTIPAAVQNCRLIDPGSGTHHPLFTHAGKHTHKMGVFQEDILSTALDRRVPNELYQ